MAARQSNKKNNTSPGRSGFLIFFLIIIVALGGILFSLKDSFVASSTTNQSTVAENSNDHGSNLRDFINTLISKNINSSSSSSSSLLSSSSVSSLNASSSHVERTQSSSSVTSSIVPAVRSSSSSSVIARSSSSRSSSRSSAASSIRSSSIASASSSSAHSSSSAVRTYNGKLYFAKITADDRVVVEPVNRAINYTDSPLIETINQLLSGPESAGLGNGVISCIPENSRLLSARVQGGVAYLNFSGEFQYNHLGREGTYQQLKQIVFTATQFPTVNSVKILIQGQEQSYLGGEGVPINKLLTRDDFS